MSDSLRAISLLRGFVDFQYTILTVTYFSHEWHSLITVHAHNLHISFPNCLQLASSVIFLVNITATLRWWWELELTCFDKTQTFDVKACF